MTWRTEALCNQLVHANKAELGWWYATGRRLRLAKTICDQCPVRRPCRDEGRANNEAGMWGGETEEERHHGRWTAPDGPDLAIEPHYEYRPRKARPEQAHNHPGPPSAKRYSAGCRHDDCRAEASVNRREARLRRAAELAEKARANIPGAAS